MDCFKIKQKLLIVLLIISFILPFYLITFSFADEGEESVSFDGVITGIMITNNSNVFVSNNNGSRHTGYITIEPGYIYHIYNNAASLSSFIATSNSVPALGGTYNYLYELPVGGDYYYRGTGEYLYLDFTTNNTGAYPTITRSKMASMDGAVNDLVSQVGINDIWGIFNISINYIVIAVCVALGIYIIFKLIKKVSKGKEGF